MGFFSNMFESSYVKQHRQATLGAEQLRLAAARALEIEIQLLATQMRIADSLHDEAYRRGFKEEGLHEVAGDFAAAMAKPTETLKWYIEGAPKVQAYLAEKKQQANSVTSLTELSDMELELRDHYVKKKPEVTEMMMKLARQNRVVNVNYPDRSATTILAGGSGE